MIEGGNVRGSPKAGLRAAGFGAREGVCVVCCRGGRAGGAAGSRRARIVWGGCWDWVLVIEVLGGGCCGVCGVQSPSCIGEVRKEAVGLLPPKSS